MTKNKTPHIKNNIRLSTIEACYNRNNHAESKINKNQNNIPTRTNITDACVLGKIETDTLIRKLKIKKYVIKI